MYCNVFFFCTGFDSVCAAHIFSKLMKRLGFNEFYIQGGDWGWLITTNMAQLEHKYELKNIIDNILLTFFLLKVNSVFNKYLILSFFPQHSKRSPC